MGKFIWLQNGYKKFEDVVEVLKCVDYLDEKRIESTFYYPKSKPDTRVGVSGTLEFKISSAKKHLVYVETPRFVRYKARTAGALSASGQQKGNTTVF